FLVVLVLHADRFTDVVDDVLVGRRVVAAGRFVANGGRGFPIGIDVAGGQGRARLVVLVQPLGHLPAARSGGRGRTVEVERGRRRRDDVVTPYGAARAVERGGLACRNGLLLRGGGPRGFHSAAITRSTGFAGRGRA